MILNLIRPIQSRSATVTVYPLMQCNTDGIRVSIALATVNSINNNLVNNASLRATLPGVHRNNELHCRVITHTSSAHNDLLTPTTPTLTNWSMVIIGYVGHKLCVFHVRMSLANYSNLFSLFICIASSGLFFPLHVE